MKRIRGGGVEERPHGKTPAGSWSKAYDAGKAVAIVLVVLAHVTRWYTEQGVTVPLRSSHALSMLTEYIYVPYAAVHLRVRMRVRDLYR